MFRVINSKNRAGKPDGLGKETVGRWWKLTDGVVAATAAMYEAVEAVSEGSVAMRTVMEKEGL